LKLDGGGEKEWGKQDLPGKAGVGSRTKVKNLGTEKNRSGMIKRRLKDGDRGNEPNIPGKQRQYGKATKTRGNL